MTNATIQTPAPNSYQKSILRANGSRRRPKTHEAAKKLIHETCAPSAPMAQLCEEYGLEVPATFGEAKALLERYETENPEAAIARRRRNAEKARAARTERRKERVQAGEVVDQHLVSIVAKAREVHGEDAATESTLRHVRRLAYRLQADSEPRKLAFGALRAGMSQKAASARIGDLKALLAA